ADAAAQTTAITRAGASLVVGMPSSSSLRATCAWHGRDNRFASGELDAVDAAQVLGAEVRRIAGARALVRARLARVGLGKRLLDAQRRLGLLDVERVLGLLLVRHLLPRRHHE